MTRPLQKMRRGALALIAASAAMAAITPLRPATAQDYPNRAVTLVLPFPAGGLADLVARRLSQNVSDQLRQQVIVDYKAGGGGTIGATAVKAAPPDGYTLLIANNSIQAINPSLMAKIQYDPVKDFAPITMLVSTSHILLVPADSPAKSVADLVALAKSKSGGLTFASAGIGGGGHLLGEMLKQKSGAAFTHVPYKGAAPAMQDVLGGRIDLYFESVALAAPHVASGGVRALAVTSRRRMAAYPDVPTMTELGYGDVQADAWFGLFAPAATPATVVSRLNGAFTAALRDPDIAKALTDNGLDVLPGTPADLSATLTTDLARYGVLIREIGARAE